MNTLQDRNTFTVKADVIFHAANHDPSGQSIIPEGNDDDFLPRAGVSKAGALRERQGLCQQRSWDTVESGSLADTGSLGAGDYLQDGGSSDSGFQDNVQCAKMETRSELLSRNGIREECGGSEVSCALDPSHNSRVETAAETVGFSDIYSETEATRSPSDVTNISAVSQYSFLVSKETRSLEQALGNLSSSAAGGGVWSQQGVAQGRHTLEAARAGECDGNGLGSSPSLQEEPDLVIEVGGQKIQAHKSVLAEKSDYFKARLSRDILKVKGVSYKTLTVLIDYVYSSRMNVNKNNMVDVVTGAKVFQMPCAVQAAVDTVSSQLTTENCYEILTIAKKQRLNELKEAAYRFMSDNFLQVLRDQAVYGRLTGSERDLVLRKRTEGRACLMAAEIDDVFERVSSRPSSRSNSRPQSPLSGASFEDSHVIYCYSEGAKDWHTLTIIPEDAGTKGSGLCCMYNYLFVAGGIRGYGEKGKPSDRVFCYNPVTDRWSEIRPMNQARSQLKLVSMDGCLYAVGGECLFTVEKYDPRSDRWTAVAPLPKGAFAVAHEATTCNGELYVSGGSLFYRLLKYDPKRNEWQECPYNNSRTKSADMVALKSFIYRFDVGRKLGVNVFKYNTIVKMWHDCASHRQGSSAPFRCVVMGNCIYCVNKNQTLQFVVEEEGARFTAEPLKAPLEAKGVLFPFVLSLPDKSDRNA